MDLTLIAIMGYVVAQLGIGAYISRKISSEDDYLIAGRNLGYGLTTFTLFATWFGAETCIGAAGAIYSDGLSGGTADPFGYALCILLMGIAFAVPIWKRRLTTLADLYRQRYSVLVERVVVCIMIPPSLLWAAAQVRAFGQVLSASSGFEVSLMITVAAGIVIAYTLFGGLLADAWTDLIQGIALMSGLTILAVVIIGAHGLEVAQTIQPEQLRLFDTTQHSILDLLEAWAIPILGSVTAAELISRAIAARSPEIAQRSAYMAFVLYLSVGAVPVFLGLVGAKLIPNLDEPEQLLPLLAQEYLPAVAYALFAGALVSAILSTVDSILLAAGSLLSHNIIVPIRRITTERQKVLFARVGVALFGVTSYVIALYAQGVYELVEQASSFGSAGLFVILVFGLFTGWGGALSALVTLIVGVVSWIAGAYWLELSTPFVASVLACFVAYCATAMLERFVRS